MTKRVVVDLLIAALASGALAYVVVAAEPKLDLNPLFQGASAQKPSQEIPLGLRWKRSKNMIT